MNQHVQTKDQSAVIEPFWERLPKFFLLPFEAPVLARIGVLALAVPVSFLLFRLGELGLVAVLAIMLAACIIGFRYGFRVIEQTARGFLRPSLYQPEFGERSVSLRPYKYIGIYLAFASLAGLAGYLLGGSQWAAAGVWILLTALILPAATMRLTLTASLRASFNPAELWVAMRGMGWAYLRLCAFVFVADMCRTTGVLLVAGVGGVGVVTLTDSQSGGLWSLLAVAGIGLAFWYFTYLICSLIGYAMYQYADALNISVVGLGERQRCGALSRKMDMRKRTRDSIVDQLADTGDLRDAIELVNDDLSQRPNDLSLHGRLHALLLKEGSTPRIEAHTDRYLDLLMASDNAREALSLVAETLRRNPMWEPRRLEHMAPLAQAALDAGKLEWVGQLIEGFDRKHPNHPDVPKLYLIAVKMLMQMSGAQDQVAALLDVLTTRYARHPAGQEAARMREHLGVEPTAVARSTLP
ncbi:MAG TPA: DUF4013 domain-containing protein [Burkholderiaceae bacterium]|nr:DUF4013 domain-containing protein [Burkholderiaceae bacterium]